MNREEWGKHLRADYRHDGYLEPNPPYNIGGTGAVMRLNAAGTQTKEYCDQEFLDEMGRPEFTNNAEFTRRKGGVIKFKFSEATGEFDPFPVLHVLRNDRVGIVMDAGANITAELGAQNVITFGMCIDAASSPVSPQRKPVYYDPGEGNRHVYIDLAQFGFDPNVIRGIWIADVLENGSKVKSAWVVGPAFPPARDDEYRLWDPMRQRFVAGVELTAETLRNFDTIRGIVADLGAKTINNLAGDYAGRKAARDVNEMIGKTLGDTMIVASAMPNFPGPIENPFNGERKAAANWKGFGRNPLPPGFAVPVVLAVKTGDVLNAARAIAVGVPVILERYGANGNRAIREFDYWPNSFDPARIQAEIPTSYDRMITTVGSRYEELRQAFIGITDETPLGRRLQYGVTRFTEKEKYSLKADRGHFIKAGQLIDDILQKLITIRTAVVGYFNGQKVGIADMTPEDVLARYNADLELLRNLCPQTNKIRDERGNLYPIIVITQAGPGAVVPDMEIRLGSAYQAIASTPREEVLPNYAGTAYSQRFLEPFARIAGGGAGGAGGAGDGDGGAGQIGGANGDGGAAAAGPDFSDLDDYVSDIIGEPRAAGAAGGVAATGGAGAPGAGECSLRFQFIGFDVPPGKESIPVNAVPLIDRFIEYYESHVGPFKEKWTILGILLDLFSIRQSKHIASPLLLERIKEELDYLKEAGVVNYLDPIPNLPQEESTISTIAYNAFNAFINRENAMQRDVGFEVIEKGFLVKLYETLEPLARAPPGSDQRATQTLEPGGYSESEPAPGPPAPGAVASPFRSRAFEEFQIFKKLEEYGSTWTSANPKGYPLGTTGTPSNSTPSTPLINRGRSRGAQLSPATAAAVAALGRRAGAALVAAATPGARAGGGRTPRRTNHKSTYRLKKKPSK